MRGVACARSLSPGRGGYATAPSRDTRQVQRQPTPGDFASLGEFLRRAVLPAVLPVLALLTVTGAVVVAPLGDVATVVVGGGAGLAVYALSVSRFAMRRGELAELRATVFPRD